MARKSKGSAFTLKSGNASTFKNLGSDDNVPTEPENYNNHILEVRIVFYQQ